jgi:hypothetical protein
MPDFNFEITPESNAVELFTFEDIPWEQLAFKTVQRTLEHYIENKGSTGFVLNDHIHL